MSDSKKKFAAREIVLARQDLERNPNSTAAMERLSWWSAYLGDFETAEEFAVTEKAKVHLEKCRMS